MSDPDSAPAPLAVLLARESSPSGGVRSHVETLVRALPDRVRFRELVLPPTPLWRKAALGVAARGSRSRGRVLHLAHRRDRLEAAMRGALAPGTLDAIHSHDVISGMASIRARDGAAARVALVHTVHAPLSREIRMDLGDERFARRVREVEAECYAGVDRLIAVDSGQAAIVREDFGIPAGKIDVIPNAVDAAAVRRAAETTLDRIAGGAWQRAPERRVLVLPRRLVEKNGPAIAIEALRHLPREWELWAIGDGPLKAELGRRGSAAGVAQRVTFMGERSHDECLAAMKLADVVVIPSVPSHGVVEATSVAALEAMALGVPVVASAIGGLAELIRPGVNGVLVPPGDPEALAAAIAALDPGQAEQLGHGGREFVEREWSVERWAERTLAVYRAACS